MLQYRLIPHERDILDGWIERQYATWRPPDISEQELRQVFGGILRSILHCMEHRALESCISDLEQAGTALAARKFPFEALIISIHFFEESYMPFLLNPPPQNSQELLVNIDEFLHVALAAIASSYFQAYRKELLDDVEVGRIVQESLLADIPSAVNDLETAHIYISARERAQVGGDFLDSFRIDEDRSAFVIGDLSGHGLEAASDSIMLRSVFRGFMLEKPDPADAMARMNRVLVRDLKSERFATALAVVYDSRSGRLQCVSAGHPHPVLCDEQCRMPELEGTALAIYDKATYTSSEMEFKPGAVFVGYTDGVSEARSSGELFGEERVLAAIAEMRDAPPRAIVEHLIDTALRHAGGKFRDDVAVLALKRRP